MQAWNHYKKINYSRYVIIAAAQRMQMRSMVSRTVLAAFAGWLGYFLEEVRRRFAIGCSVWRQGKKSSWDSLAQSDVWIFAILAWFRVLPLVQKYVMK